MEYFGLIAFFMALGCLSQSGRIDDQKKRIAKLEKQITKPEKGKEGKSEMSKMIESLIGSKCKVDLENDFTADEVSTILEVDEEWVKMSSQDKKGKVTTKIVRIENINSIEIVNE